MEIVVSDNNEIIVHGIVKSLNDYLFFRDVVLKTINEINTKEINIIFTETPTITSSMIGFLIKLIHLDKIKINIKVFNENLYELFDSLNLIDIFNVTKA